MPIGFTDLLVEVLAISPLCGGLWAREGGRGMIKSSELVFILIIL